MLLCCLLCNTEASCHTLRRRLPSKTNSVTHQRQMSSTHWSVAAKYIALHTHSMPCSQLLAQNRDFCLPHLHATSPLEGFLLEYCHPVWYGKTRMTLLPGGEKMLKICLFVLTQFTNMTDTHTQRQTDRQTPHDGKSRA